MEQNSLEAAMIDALQSLKKEISDGVVKPFAGTLPDQEYWLDFLALYEGKRWLEVPFYFVEAYFYRRILEATGFVHNHLDPFQKTKNAELSRNTAFFEKAINDQQSAQHNSSWKKGLKRLLMLNLWGNKSA